MNPFAARLRSFRIDKGLRQSDLAEQIGYEQSYISALEIGIKGPPTPEFVLGLVRVLNLSNEEHAILNEAVAASQRKISIPNNAAEEVYWLCHDLQQQLDHLHPAQISLIRTALNLPQDLGRQVAGNPPRLKRRTHETYVQEAQM